LCVASVLPLRWSNHHGAACRSTTGHHNMPSTLHSRQQASIRHRCRDTEQWDRQSKRLRQQAAADHGAW
jgi:hypothetical protein